MRKFLKKLCLAPLLFIVGIISIPFQPFIMGLDEWMSGRNTVHRLIKALLNFLIGCAVCWLTPLLLLFWLFFEYDSEG